jgi:hypothetical protein
MKVEQKPEKLSNQHANLMKAQTKHFVAMRRSAQKEAASRELDMRRRRKIMRPANKKVPLAMDHRFHPASAESFVLAMEEVLSPRGALLVRQEQGFQPILQTMVELAPWLNACVGGT